MTSYVKTVKRTINKKLPILLIMLACCFTASFLFTSVANSTSAGQKVVYQKSDQIYRMTDEGEEVRFLTMNARIPSWSPDGRSIVFERTEGAFIHIGNQRLIHIGRGISIMDEFGNRKRPITVSAADRDPSFSPDGMQIIFARGNTLRIVEVDEMLHGAVDTSRELYRFDRGVVRGPQWSPDGTKIVVEHAVGEGSEISVLNVLHNRGRTVLAESNIRIQPLNDIRELNSNPAWGQYGRYIYFDRGQKDGDKDIFAADITRGRALVVPELVNPDTRDTDPAPYFLGNGRWGFTFTRYGIADGNALWQNIYRSEYDHFQHHTFIDPLTQTFESESNSDRWPESPEQAEVSGPGDPEGNGDNPNPGQIDGGDENSDGPCAIFERFPDQQQRCIEAEEARQRRLEEDRRRIEEQRRQAAERNRPGQNWPSPGQWPQQKIPNNSLPGLGDLGKNSLKESGLLPKSDNSLLRSQLRLLKGAKYRRGKGKSGYVKVRVKCYAMPGKRCNGTLKLYTKKRYKIGRGKKIRILIGEKKFSITPNLKAKGKNKSVSETEILGPKKSKTVTEMYNEKVLNRPRTIKVRLRPATQAGWSVTAKRIASKAVSATTRKLNKRHTVRLKARATVISKEIDSSETSKTSSKSVVVKPKKIKIKNRK